MSLAIVNEINFEGILPLHEIISRARAGEIRGNYLSMLLLGRLADEIAKALPDGSAYLCFWVDVSAAVEDWFEERARRRDRRARHNT
jgi:predicted acylesterase/phospholipase RssA